jgi:hypothetical protein
MRYRSLPVPTPSRLQTLLSPSDPPRRADLIFVFAGQMSRKDYALDLLRQGLAPAVLLSVGRFEIRRFSKMSLPAPLDLLQIAQSIHPPQRHYFVFFREQTVHYEHLIPTRFGTLFEVRSLARWLAKHPEIRSLLVISSATHLRRIRLCCRAFLPRELAIGYVAAPQTSTSEAHEDTRIRWLAPNFLELIKLFAYWFLLKFERKPRS